MLKEIAKNWGITYPLARWEPPVPQPFNQLRYPAALLIDRKGILRRGIVGPFLKQLERDLLAALKEKPPANAGTPAEKKPAPKQLSRQGKGT